MPAPYAVRDAVPIAPAGTIRLLDEVERRLQSGRSLGAGVEVLLRAGVRHLVVRNDLDRFHLVMDVIDRVPAVGPRGPQVRQAMRERLAEHGQYIAQHGEDLPDVRGWIWPH